jgi:hypothetical protein
VSGTQVIIATGEVRLEARGQPSVSKSGAQEGLDDPSQPTEGKGGFHVGGLVPANAATYIERDADRRLGALLREVGEVGLIWGPRMIGKSSVLGRLGAHAVRKGLSFVYVDFQAMMSADWASVGAFVIGQIARQASVQLEDITPRHPPIWHHEFETVLRALPRSTLLSFDETDRLATDDMRTQFFSFLRHLHESRSLPQARSSAVSILACSYASPDELVEDVNRSPFNVSTALSIRLESFNRAQSRQLLSIGHLLSDRDDEILFGLLGGHPWLTHLTARMLAEGASIDDVRRAIYRPDGPLSALRMCLRAELERGSGKLGSIARRVVRGQKLNGFELYSAIERGLLVHTEDGGYRFSSDAVRHWVTQLVEE